MAAHAQNHTHYLPHALVWEILSWLPVKSLMRFKCVSRIWLSVIMDPSFATAHQHRGGRGRRGFLVPTDTRVDQCPRLTNMRYFFYVNLDDDDDRQVVSCYLGVTHGSNWMGITDLVNGLICFYNRNYSYLYNVATREALQLAVSNNDSQACSYHFGFDPVNKLYKLLKICPVYDGYNEHSQHFAYKDAVFVRHLNCEVLTIGVDSSWRIIDPPPHREIKTRGVCLGGCLYWMECTDAGDDKGLIGFDLVGEKFQVISLPGLIMDDAFYLPCCGPSLVLFLVSILGRGKVEALMMARGEKWGDEQKLILQTSNKSDLTPRGILPNGKLLIFDGHPDNDRSIYLYDQSKRVLEKQVVISLAPPFSGASRYIELEDFLYFEENIIPLSSLFTSTTTTT